MMKADREVAEGGLLLMIADLLTHKIARFHLQGYVATANDLREARDKIRLRGFILKGRGQDLNSVNSIRRG